MLWFETSPHKLRFRKDCDLKTFTADLKHKTGHVYFVYYLEVLLLINANTQSAIMWQQLDA